MNASEFCQEALSRWPTKSEALKSDLAAFASAFEEIDLPKLLRHMIMHHDSEFFPKVAQVSGMAKDAGITRKKAGSAREFYYWKCKKCERYFPGNASMVFCLCGESSGHWTGVISSQEINCIARNRQSGADTVIHARPHRASEEASPQKARDVVHELFGEVG